MSKHAARKTDSVSHGGQVLLGSSDVVTEGQPSARYGDIVVCELHGVALVDQTSQTVFVNGVGFARETDGCLCAGGGAAVGPGQAELVELVLEAKGSGKTIEELLEERGGYGLMAQALISDANADGELDTAAVRGALAGLELRDEHGSFAMEAFGFQVDAANVEGAYAIDGIPALNRTTKLHASGAALKTTGEAHLDDEVSLKGTGKLLSGEAGAEGFGGHDGRRSGFALKGGAKAAAISGKGTTTIDSTAGGFLDRMARTSPAFAPAALGARALGRLSPTIADALATPLKLEIGVGGSLASVGLDGGAEAYYDHQSEETVLGLEGGIAALLGIALDVKLTIGGDPAGGPTGGAGPNLIASGAANVFVGD